METQIKGVNLPFIDILIFAVIAVQMRRYPFQRRLINLQKYLGVDLMFCAVQTDILMKVNSFKGQQPRLA
jgi:hypothetical protein